MSKWVTVVVPRGGLLFPNACPGCLRPSPSSDEAVASDYGRFGGYYVLFATTKHLVAQIPHCSECAGRLKRIRTWSAMAILAGLAGAVVVDIRLGLSRFWEFAVAVAFCAPGIIASEYLGRAVRIGKYDKDRVEFRFKSTEYAAQFESLNTERAAERP